MQHGSPDVPQHVDVVWWLDGDEQYLSALSHSAEVIGKQNCV